MAYFANGTEGDCLNEQCDNCLHGMNEMIMCPVALVQTTCNYKQLEDGNEALRAAMNMLVDEHGICLMRNTIKLAGLVIDLSERDQLQLI